jgi:hypothetical protein
VLPTPSLSPAEWFTGPASVSAAVGVGGNVSTNHSVLLGSTPGWGYQTLLLLAFLMSMDDIIHNDGIAHKFQESLVSVECKALL